MQNDNLVVEGTSSNEFISIPQSAKGKPTEMAEADSSKKLNVAVVGGGLVNYLWYI